MLTDIDIDIKLAFYWQQNKLQNCITGHHWTIGWDLNHTQNSQLTASTDHWVRGKKKTENETHPLSFLRLRCFLSNRL